REENAKIIRHIEAGGVSTLLYGGNANFYHIAPSEYADALEIIATESAENTLVVPSVGPAYGTMMDQAKVLQDFDFPTVMVLPMQGLTTDAGVAAGFRKFVEALGKPAVLYIKFEGYLEPETVASLVDEGLVSWIKYAIVRKDTTQDDYLSRLIELVDPRLIVSGIGEQPAIIHLTKFKINGFTSGCVCVRPDLSQKMLTAINSGDLEQAEKIRGIFQPLEDLRNEINPIRVLHGAVAEVRIAQTGPPLPLLSGLDPADAERVQQTAQILLNQTCPS
ncbi:MAG: dihydrodipicolinate synthase family protein, partial [Akkermansiaceae bacterium]